MSTPNPPAAVLAFDAGNSKTDVALVASDGALLGSARGPGASAQNVGMEASVAIYNRLIEEAAAAAGFRRDGRPLAHHLAAYVAGADLPAEEEALDIAFRAENWGVTTTVANDTFAVLRAGTDRTWGVGIVCGAGINCVGIRPDGTVARFPSLGQITGDWGGGSFLSKEVMWWATRAEDGRGPATALRGATAEHFGMRRVGDVAAAVHFGDLQPERLLELTYVLFAVAADGDAIARQLIERLAEEVVVMGVVALRRLDLLDVDTHVVLGGGLLTARDPLLMNRIEERFSTDAPRAVPRVVTVPPIAGAALLGLDRIGAGPAAESRLRAAYGAGADVEAPAKASGAVLSSRS